GGRHASAPALEGRKALDSEARAPSRLLEQRDIALAPVSEAEVGPDADRPRMERLDQHPLDEVLRRELAEGAVEGEHYGGGQAASREELELLVVAHQGRGALLRRHDAQRVAVEGEGGRHERVAPRVL